MGDFNNGGTIQSGGYNAIGINNNNNGCLLHTYQSPRDRTKSRMQ